jgi:PAS domain S-box-containing protein
MNSPDIGTGAVPREMFETLEKAFRGFQERADALSHAYASMQDDFRKVNIQLDQRNRELAESLARQEETQTYLNSILESMSNGVVGIDTAGLITQFNEAAVNITGYSVDEVFGRPWSEVFEQDARTGTPNVLTVLRSGKGHLRDEKTIWHRDGNPIPVSFQSSVLRDKSGRTLGAVEIFSDVSRIKALEEEMQRTRTMAAVGEMAATVAHEIRNPLGAMGVWAGLLERDFDHDDPRRDTLRKITDALARLNRIVSNLLVYSRPVRPELRKIELRELLDETVKFVEIEAERLGREIAVQRDWREQECPQVLADPEKLQQIIMNLCLNAVQAMDDGGELTVKMNGTSGRNGKYASFAICDTGAGIEERHLARIFDPFYTTKEQGTGLGLAIVKKFVEHHSGHITARSKPGEGTTFTVFLPYHSERG